jgi:hypothetical protein
MNRQILLSPWRKRLVTILYHYTSLDYLKGLLPRVNALISYEGGILDEASLQGRDTYLQDPKWGSRNTASNWSTHASPSLLAFREDTVKDIARHAFEIYRRTGAHQCARMLAEYSMVWSTVEQEKKFKEMFEQVYHYAEGIDDTTCRDSSWNDFWEFVTWPEVSAQYPRLPKYVVRTDIQAESARIPPRTGVYIPQDDELGGPAFAWTGGDYGYLPNCATLNALGREALAFCGRDRLWRDEQRMLEFVSKTSFQDELKQDSFYELPIEPHLAPSLVARQAYEYRPARWYFVERIEGEWEEEQPVPLPTRRVLRALPKEVVPKTGWWHTPALKADQSRRYFKEGERFPDIDVTQWGSVIWYFDSDKQ